MNRKTSGFTLVELLVVLTIISLLAGVLTVSVLSSTAESRDAQRKADLRTIQNAVELYKLENGRYPKGCRDANPAVDADGDGNAANDGDDWSGEQGTNYACTGSDTRYIVGLTPKYLPVLPTDPELFGPDSGYAYITNPNGTVYKFVAMKTVETEEFISYSQDFPFKACDVKTVGGSLFTTTPTTGLPQEGTSGGNPFYGYATCNRYRIPASYTAAPDCSIAVGASARTTYAVWGGFGNPEDAVGAPAAINTDEKKVEYATERIVCDLP